MPTWCGVKTASGNLRRCSSTRSRNAPGRVAGARRPVAAALITRRPWAAWSRAVARAVRAAGRSPVRPRLSAGLPGLAFGAVIGPGKLPAGVLPVLGASAGGAGSAADLQVSGRPGRLPFYAGAAPTFSCASRACRAAAALIPACPAITATVAPPDSADRAARAVAVALSAAGRARGAR